MNSSAVSVMEEMNRIASIKMMTWKVTTGIFFALAIISVIARAGIRCHSRPKPAADDYFVFFGCACLIIATGLLYRNFNNMYATQAIWQDPMFMLTYGYETLETALKEFNTYNKIALSLLWTTTFSVKLSFLAFFRQLIQSVENIRRYYIFVVCFTILSWMFVIAEPHILCPYVGMKSMKCASNFSGKLYFSLTGLVTALDVLTDLLLVSIPIIVLHRANMRNTQKAAVGAFMSLSLVMVVLAICRGSKMKGQVAIDIPYEMFWQFLESEVAILMASLTAYRTFFVLYKERQRYQARMKGPSNSFRLFNLKKESKDTASTDSESQLPQIPRPTMTGLRTFIRGNNRTDMHSNVLSDKSLVTTSHRSDQASFITKPDGILRSITTQSTSTKLSDTCAEAD